MDKHQLNNEIVSLRKFAKKTKLYIIQRLVRNVKNLKKRTAKKPVESFQRKIDRLLQEISEIKKLSFDEISKFVLSNKKTPGEILRNTQSSSKERALARFCDHKILVAPIDKIKSEFPNLEDLLCSINKSKTKKKKKPVNKINAESNRKGNMFQGVLSPSSEGRLICNKNEDTDDSDNNSDKSINENVSENSDNESDADSETDDGNMNKSITTKPMTHTSFDKNIPSSSKHKVKERKVDAGNAQNNKPKTEIDSFFLTDNGEYESCIVKDLDSPEPSNNMNKKLKSSRKNSNFESKVSWKDQTRKETNFSKKKFQEKSFQPKGGKNNKNFKKKMSQPVSHSIPNKIQKIHPSWEAKKKQKEQLQSIHSFQGKKKKFDE